MSWFLVHSICSVLAALLAIILGISSWRRKFKHHKLLAWAMAFFAVIGLIGSFEYGIAFSLNNLFSAYQLHNLLGFAALFSSVLPFFFRKSKFHCQVAYLAAFLAALSILSGFAAYYPLIVGFSPVVATAVPTAIPTASATAYIVPSASVVSSALPSVLPSVLPSLAPSAAAGCITLQQMQAMNRCVFAVDDTIYDMSNMPGWGSGSHYGHLCGGSITKQELLALAPSHTDSRYFGPVVGKLC